jgi:uncharacterized YigZ family protein
MEIENYHTIGGPTESKIKIKGSVFISHSFPIHNLDEAHWLLEELKKKYFDATHICYALCLADKTIRYSDAGEPQGTAGIRIFNAINHFNLKNILIAVVRYFGGTKLGIGPLGKAYYECAFSNLNSASKIEMKKFVKVKIKTGFNFLGNLYNILSSCESKITNTVYSEEGDNVILDVFIISKIYPHLVEEINNGSNGKAFIEKLEELFF